MSPNALRGRRIGQALLGVMTIWVIVSGTTQILREAVFAPVVVRSADVCRAELLALRTKLYDATLESASIEGELAAVFAFRQALGNPAARPWDARLIELVDGCPPKEREIAQALGRLRASNEAMVRLDAHEAGPARRAHALANRP